MKAYRLDAFYRAKDGREVMRKCPVWTGHAANAREAIKAAHTAIGEDCKAARHIDRVSVHAKGEDGEEVMTTEFAEDFTIGYGASAAGSSNLAGDGVEHKLTPEQEAEAHARVKAAAVDALIGASPKIAEELRGRTMERQLDATAAADDGFGGFFDEMGHKPKEVVTLPGGLPGAAHSGHGAGPRVPGSGAHSGDRHTVSAGPGCDKSVRDCRHKFNNLDHYGGSIKQHDPTVMSPCPHTLGDAACGVTGGVAGRKPGFPGGAHGQRGPSDQAGVGRGADAGHADGSLPGRQHGGLRGGAPADAHAGAKQREQDARLKRAGQAILEDLERSVQVHRRNGRIVDEIVLSGPDVERVAKALDTDPSRVPGHTINGVPVRLGDSQKQPPQIQSRNKDKQKPLIFGTVLTPSGVMEHHLTPEEERIFKAHFLGTWEPS